MTADIQAPPAEGRAYREGVYQPIEAAALPDAPDAGAFAARGHGPALKRFDRLPRVPRLRDVVGPSMIALGMGLGAGEFLLWPNLVASGGYSVLWLFTIGVLTQFIVISEIERWTVATGESVFAGMARVTRGGFWPWFFLAATLASFFWPGWAAESAVFIASVIATFTGGAPLPWQPIALVMMLVIYIALAGSTIVYNALEKFEIWLVILFIPLLFISMLLAGVTIEHVRGVLGGMVAVGPVPVEFVSGTRFPTLVLAVAYAGMGGTLLLCQSLWVRDKGFGMGTYQGRVAGIRGTNEPLSESGFTFDAADATMRGRFHGWMRLAQAELFVTFVLLTLLSVVLTALIVAATLGTGNAAAAGNLMGMVHEQARVLSQRGGVLLEVSFLLGGALILFSTQVGIMDTVTRITGDIFHERYGRRTTFWTMKRTFLLFLTVLVVASCAIIVASWVGHAGLDQLQPDFLLLIAGPFTITSMWLFTLVVAYINVRLLPRELAPPAWKRVGMFWAAVLWGWFTAEQLSRVVLREVVGNADAAGHIVAHPVRYGMYGVWVASVLWLAVVLAGRGGGLRRPSAGAD